MLMMTRLAAELGRMRSLPAWFGAVGVVTLLNGCVAVLAFGKDVLLATYFGTSVQADALTLAYFVPDMLGNNVLAAAVGAACVPVFARDAALHDWRSLRRTVLVSLALYSMIAIALTAMLFQGSGYIVARMTGSMESELSRSTLELLPLLLPIIVPFPAFMIGTALLQANLRFTLPAAAPLVPHVTTIAVLGFCFGFSLTKEMTAAIVALGMLIGVVIMAASIWGGLLRGGHMHRSETGAAKSVLANQKDIGKVFVPYLLILCTAQSVYVVERLLAAHFEVGTVAALNYAFRLAQFPILVFVAAVSAVVLPSLSQNLALNRIARLRDQVGRAFSDILIVTLPTTLLFFLLREPIVAALFQRGAFTSESVRVTSDLLAGFALTIAPMALSAVCLRYFLAAGRIAAALAVSAISVAIQIASDYVLTAKLGAVGLGYGAAIGAAANAIMMLALLARQLSFSNGNALRRIRTILAANIAPSVLLIVGSQALNRVEWLRENGGVLPNIARIAFVGGTIMLVGAVYAVCLVKLGIAHPKLSRLINGKRTNNR